MTNNVIQSIDFRLKILHDSTYDVDGHSSIQPLVILPNLYNKKTERTEVEHSVSVTYIGRGAPESNKIHNNIIHKFFIQYET